MYNISPRPNSFSAPGVSIITLESIMLETLKAMRQGILALIKPVITSTDGRWVDSTRWIPVARAIWAILVTASSTSDGANNMISASSSTMIIRYGKAWNPDISLNISIFLAPTSANNLYRRSISLIDHFKADTTFSGSTITGVSKWGIPLYCVNSTRLGSTRMSFTSCGLARNKNVAINEFKQILFPEPVLPAINTWGILPISAITGSPDTSKPKATVNFDFAFCITSASSIRRIGTNSGVRLGISMPTSDRPGIGASILICPVGAANAKAKSFCRAVILDNLVPREISKAYWVTAGP